MSQGSAPRQGDVFRDTTEPAARAVAVATES